MRDDELVDDDDQAAYDRAFARGRRGRAAGLALKDNPYGKRGRTHVSDRFLAQAWRHGWTDEDQARLAGGRPS